VLATDLFGTAFGTNSAWMFVMSDNPQIAGFFLFFDDAVSFLHGADAGNQNAATLYFTETSSALINLINPRNDQTRDVTLDLLSDTGQNLSHISIPTIPPAGVFSATLASLFPALAQDPTE